MGETALINDWLFLQVPAIVVLSLWVWWLQDKYNKTIIKLDKSNDEKSEMAKEMIQFVKIIKENIDMYKDNNDKEMLKILRDGQNNNSEILNTLKSLISERK
jgi:hypothetical protein